MPPAPRRPTRDGYPTAERLHRLVEWLRSGERLTTNLAAEALGVSRRTIARDLTHLREVLSLRVEYDPVQRSYVLDDEHAALPFLAFPSLAPVLLNGQPNASEGTPVHVRFSADVIQSYRKRGGQIDDEAMNPDGTVDAHFAPHSLDEFLTYVLSRGHNVEVVGPPAYRRRIQMEIRRMLTIYDADGDSAA